MRATLIWIALAIVILAAGGALYYAYATSAKLDALSEKLKGSQQTSGDLALETRCADAAAKFYKAWDTPDPRYTPPDNDDDV